MIAIVDYGMGNLHSVQKALEYAGAQTIITDKPQDVQTAEKIVLPGVGAFDDAIRQLRRRKLVDTLKGQLNAKKPFLGICLGMQLLFQRSQEAEDSSGLGIIKGQVRRFVSGGGLKVPHMGWNQLIIRKNNCPLLTGIGDGSYVYFCHSYYPQPEDNTITAASCNYGIEFSCVIWQDNIYAVQFHPEKSQNTGLKIIKNFVELC
ncbi:MAG: imidazole glycerol phosphate synthase subunit HisH [Candidatus Omnitrophica bacterium]|nr:imidazole glycerol phosphate synthase subunit HisH [Candidatus Omnitrophota bacterium]